MFRALFKTTLRRSKPLNIKWISEPKEPFRIQIEGERAFLLQYQKKLAEQGIPSMQVPSPCNKKMFLEAWYNGKTFLQTIDHIAEKTMQEETVCNEKKFSDK
jgi:hypothetical protein